MVVNLPDACGLDTDLRPMLVISVVAEWHKRVQSVVPAGQLEYHEYAAIARSLRPERLSSSRK